MTKQTEIGFLASQGPWEVTSQPSADDHGMVDLPATVMSSDGLTTVAEVCGGLPLGEQMANALLIAAAPELLERADELLGILAVYADGWQNKQGEYGDIFDSMDNLRVAINKATKQTV